MGSAKFGENIFERKTQILAPTHLRLGLHAQLDSGRNWALSYLATPLSVGVFVYISVVGQLVALLLQAMLQQATIKKTKKHLYFIFLPHKFLCSIANEMYENISSSEKNNNLKPHSQHCLVKIKSLVMFCIVSLCNIYSVVYVCICI